MVSRFLNIFLSNRIQIFVYAAPPKLVKPSDIVHELIEGQDVMLPCEVYGLPPPSITWLLNGHPLDTKDSRYVNMNNSLG